MADDNPGESRPVSFLELMALKQLPSPHNTDPDAPEKIERFESLSRPYAPGLGTIAFGGHVYTQSAYAASKTVPQGLVIHDMTGTFILPGQPKVPYVYTVRHLRDGIMYSTRAVDVRQGGQICFSCLCSFKRIEAKDTFTHQPPPAQERFQSILAGKKPEEHQLSPSVDADWWIDLLADSGMAEPDFPGLDVRKVDMKDYNLREEVKRSPELYRQLTLYSLKGAPAEGSIEDLRRRDQEGEFDNLYACAHMYSSDKNSLLLITRALGMKHWTAMASLTLTVVFHEHGEALRMLDWDVADGKTQGVPRKWFIQEGWTPRSGENRAVHESGLWSPTGTLLATSYQDSVLRGVSEVGKL